MPNTSLSRQIRPVFWFAETSNCIPSTLPFPSISSTTACSSGLFVPDWPCRGLSMTEFLVEILSKREGASGGVGVLHLGNTCDRAMQTIALAGHIKLVSLTQ